MCQQSENQVHFNEAAFVPEFSEGNSGSSFFEWKWTAGSMSGLDAEVEWRTMDSHLRPTEITRTQPVRAVSAPLFFSQSCGRGPLSEAVRN
jgi:hypothetical protein